MIKAAIFDFNGTLFDDIDIHREIWREIYIEKTEGLEDFDEFFNSIMGAKNQDLIVKMYEHIGKTIEQDEIDKISLEKEEKYRDYSIKNDKCHLINGAERVFDELAKKMPINLSSTSIKENIDFYFSEFGIGRWIDRNNVTYDDGILKTKVEMYTEAAKNLNVELKDCLIFEDSQYGIDSAYAAGCRNIIVIDPRGLRKMSPGVIQIVKDYTEVDLSFID